MLKRWMRKVGLALTDQFLFSGSGFLLSIMAARWMTPAQYGSYALAFSVFLFASSFHNAIILEPMGVLGPASYARHLPAYIARLIKLHTFVALGLTSLILVGAGLVFILSRNATLAMSLCGASLAVPCVLLSWLLRQSAYLDHRPNLAACGGATYGVVLTTVLFGLHKWGWMSPFSAFLSQIVAGIAAAVVMTWLIRPDTRPTPEVSLSAILSQHWKYGRWVILTAFVYWLSGQSYYFIAAGVLGISEVATMRALQNLLLPLSQFLMSLSLLAVPWASTRFASNDRTLFERTIRKVSLLFAATGVLYLALTVSFGQLALDLLYGGKYDGSGMLLPILALSGSLIAVAQGPTIGLRAMQAPAGVFVGYAVSGGIALVIGVPMTRYWGLHGAAAGMAISSASFLLTVGYRYYAHLDSIFGVQPEGDPICPEEELRVAWLLPSMARAFCWQPLLRAFSDRVSECVIYTGVWPGFLSGYETLDVRVLSGFKFTAFKRNEEGYHRGVFRPPLGIVRELFHYRPNVLFVSGFSLWTVIAVIAKAMTSCRVIILWEGVSPSVTFLDSKCRLTMRRWLARFADAGVSNMREGVTYLRDYLRMPDFKLVHHPYEVPDLDVICSTPAEVNIRLTNGPVFLFIGSIIARKGWRYLLDAAGKLVDSGYRSFSVVLIGGGEQMDQLIESISAKGLGNLVHVLGQVEYAALGSYFAAADVFVFPTLEDTWGLVVLEALASGKPVLCSKYAGSAEMIEATANGYVFDPRDPDELAGYMERFLLDPGLSRRLGQRATEMMRPHTPFSAARVLAELAKGNPPSTLSERTDLVNVG